MAKKSVEARRVLTKTSIPQEVLGWLKKRGEIEFLSVSEEIANILIAAYRISGGEARPYIQAPTMESSNLSKSFYTIKDPYAGSQNVDHDAYHVSEGTIDRSSTKPENSANVTEQTLQDHPKIDAQRRLQRRTQSGFKGVYRYGKNWKAGIMNGGKLESIGVFADAEEAARAYDARARELLGANAYLNFPEAGEKSVATGGVNDPEFDEYIKFLNVDASPAEWWKQCEEDATKRGVSTVCAPLPPPKSNT